MEKFAIAGRTCFFEKGADPAYLLIQPVDEHEVPMLEAELSHIRELTKQDFAYLAFMTADWNSELSPWAAPPVFGNEAFGGGGESTLAMLTDSILPKAAEDLGISGLPLVIGGYSLAGLFALWAVYRSDIFSAAACASPSVWFGGWREFAEVHRPLAEAVYLSIGNKEEKARSRTLAAVGENIRRQHELLKEQGTASVLEINEGNHFKEADLRTARAFAWCLEKLSERR